MPYATLNGLMTTNQYERGLLGNFRMLLATAGRMTVNTVKLDFTAWKNTDGRVVFVLLNRSKKMLPCHIRFHGKDFEIKAEEQSMISGEIFPS